VAGLSIRPEFIKEFTGSVRKLQSWLDGGGKSPNEQVVKSRLKAILRS